jgi:hypothetical protein
MTKSTQRARGASKPKSAIRQRAKKNLASESLKASKGRYRKTDIEPEDFFKAWSREELGALIELLIESLDAESGDPDLEETGDAEPSLGFQAGDIHVGRGCEHGCPSDDREIEDEHDEDTHDQEDDGLQQGEGDTSDYEPILGWTESGHIHATRQGDADGECEGDVHTGHGQDVQEARNRRRKPDTIRTEPTWGGFAARRILNLTPTQRVLIKPRLGREVRI